MENCVFCKIVRGEIPANRVEEDADFVAFLGILPKYPGMTVIVTRRHTGDSYVYKSMTDEDLAKMHLFAKKVALRLDRALGSLRCIQVMEGFDIKDHAHLKLFPVYDGKPYDCSYEGTKQASGHELAKVAEKIRASV